MIKVFEFAKQLINDSCQEKSYDIKDKLFLRGFIIEDLGTNVGRIINDRYTVEDKYFTIILTHRCIDPSRPFQNIPDVHKFEIRLFQDDKEIESYCNEFSER